MAFLSSIPLIGKIFDGLFGIIDEAVEDKDEKNKLKADLTKVYSWLCVPRSISLPSDAP